MLYLTKIRNAESEFTENEQKIADFLRANVSELQSVSSRQMAKQLGISQSSIVKFAQKLGAQGFTELRMALIGEYSASREKTNATALHLHSSITSDDSLEVIARKVDELRRTGQFSDAEFWGEVAACLTELHSIRWPGGTSPVTPPVAEGSPAASRRQERPASPGHGKSLGAR